MRPDDSILVVGTIAGQVTFGTGTPYQTTLNGGQLGSMLVAGFAGDGTFRAGRVYSAASADGISVRSLPDGSAIVTGQFEGQIILDVGLPTQVTLVAAGGANDYDTFLAHVGADGNVIWAARAGGPKGDFPVALDVAADGSGALAGVFSGSITFNPGQANAITLSRPGNFQDNYVARFDASGHVTWARASGGTGANDLPKGVAVLADGTVALSGSFYGNTSFEGQMPPLALMSAAASSLFLAHYQANGTLDWVRSPSGYSAGFHVRQGPAGDLLVTGAADSAAVFGQGEPTQASLGGSGGDFVARYQEDGSFLGIGLLGTLLTENDMLVDTGGAVAVVGSISNKGTFATAGMPTTITSLGWEDAYTACAAPSGQVAWVSHAGGNQHDIANAVARAGNGDLVVVGGFTADMTVNPGQPGAVNLTVGLGDGNAFLVRYSP